MKFTLEPYQSKAVEGVLSNLAKARAGYLEDGERSAIGLTAPTGAGKTVIATAVLEGIYKGTPTRAPIPQMTVLWITDDRALNAQTISKITQASGGSIDINRIWYIGEVDQRTLEPGFIYFVHIQAMQKNSTLHAVRADGSPNDKRSYGAWDMIANTVRDRGQDFLVIWDEAHRGSGTKNADRKSIAGTIVGGGPTNIGTVQPPAPVVLGISATPDRFQAAMQAADRTMRLVDVKPGDVRESGLLKDRILLRSLGESQAADNTMLALAVKDLKSSDAAWHIHHETTGDRLVKPLLVVQVEQGLPPAKEDARLAETLAVLESTWPELSDYAIAHSFGDPHGPKKVGNKTIRYLPPEAISGDDQARVVLFKSALTTGWDCPRAEVMISFQNKDSFTEIAQLIGRLVRTPLTKRIEGGDDRLNEVAAYLPGFRTEHVARVVNALTEDETVEVDVVVSPVMCEKSPDVPAELFDLLDTVPSHRRQRAVFSSRTGQLMHLAAALTEHGIVERGSAKAKQWIVDQIRAADSQRSSEIDVKVKDIMSLTISTTMVSYGETILQSIGNSDTPTNERDLEGYFRKAKRLLPDGSANWYFNDLCDRDYDDVDANARLAAMADLGFKDIIEEQAEALITSWRQQHAAKISAKPRHVRDQIEPLWHLGNTPMVPTTVEVRDVYPAATERVRGKDVEPIDTYPHHIYVILEGKHAGRFPVDTSRSSWERQVLDSELASETLVGWYRNPSSGRHALAVPYEFGDKYQLMHPDFLFWHDDGDGEYVMDIVDPHRFDLADTSAKWSALAWYAQDHPDRIRRCIAVAKVGDSLRALDLTTPGIAERIAKATNQNLMEAVFIAEGVAYP
ncbi:DEAD/DEAH box helicase family protein (plasmid) [Rhodococcus aetherivorans]|uniref:DEAD/DEAH box helicase family protein n=1 Tax=Rhodococcus aetherivorans TaxID=191292 RepID=A0AA46P573_9NOCA|nr:DEAD/DEAH box helicase family protein [Rhodococcus aetherivorans]UYF97183.1 DEAD/DEAH box helicase family protein [Rhodococcus aetherivorans]